MHLNFLYCTLLPFLELFLRYSKAQAGATVLHLNLCVGPTMTQAEREHATQCISLVHTDTLCFVCVKYILL